MKTLTNLQNTSPLSIFLSCNIISLVFILFVIASGIYKLNISTEFNEYGLATTYSVLLLVLIALINGGIFLTLYKKSSFSESLIWLLICIGFIFLALDEKFLIHENLDFFIHKVLNLKETQLSDRIDDIIILIYGLIGLGAMIKYRQQFLNNKPALITLIIGGAFLVASAVLDIVTNEGYFAHSITDNEAKVQALIHLGFIAEESTKILSETSFIAAFLMYLQHYKIEVQITAN